MLGQSIALRVLLCAIGLFGAGTLWADEPAVIPIPVAMERHEGVFQITAATVVAAGEEAAAEARKLIDALAPAMGFRLKQVAGETPNADEAGKKLGQAPNVRDSEPVSFSRDSGAIVLAIDDSLRRQLGGEGYTLHVTTDRGASPGSGLVFGVQAE